MRTGYSSSRNTAIVSSPLLAGLDAQELASVLERMRPCMFQAGEEICRAGEPADCIWVITGGLVHWQAASIEAGDDLLLRLRKGDVIGAQDAVVGETRSATVVASIATSALELDRDGFMDLARRYPQILVNIVGHQRERLLRASARRVAEQQQWEEIAVVTGPSMRGIVSRLLTAARHASPRPITVPDRRLSLAGTLTAAEDLAASAATVLIPTDLEPETIALMLEELDRVVAIVGTPDEAERLGDLVATAQGRLEVVLVGEEAARAAGEWPEAARAAVVRTCARGEGFPLDDRDIAWIARHLTRTKLGIALGAGGSKGYAHVGVLQVLEENGFVVDYAGGSSIGGFVASHVALGHDAAAVDARFRAAFNPEAVNALFSSPLGGGKAVAETLTKLLREATEDRSFSDTSIPLVIMAVDLAGRVPWPQREGTLWEALLAALAVAGVFPPREQDGRRLIDAIAMVPVPTAAVVDDGADLVLSVNLMGAETLDRWPEGTEAVAPPERKGRRGPLDTILEAMDLSQLDTSARHAALADVVVTPRFAATDWRDFHLADLFLAAGRRAAEEQLQTLQALARPIDMEAVRREAPVV